MSNLDFLRDLEAIIGERIDTDSARSYTAKLAASGDKRVAQKLGEEAVELALAATAGDRDEQIDEAADLVFHLLVLLSTKGLSLEDVVARLKERHELANGS